MCRGWNTKAQGVRAMRSATARGVLAVRWAHTMYVHSVRPTHCKHTSCRCAARGPRALRLRVPARTHPGRGARPRIRDVSSENPWMFRDFSLLARKYPRTHLRSHVHSVRSAHRKHDSRRCAARGAHALRLRVTHPACCQPGHVRDVALVRESVTFRPRIRGCSVTFLC